MCFIRFIFVFLTIFLAYSCSNKKKDISELLPEYKMLKNFSRKIKPQTGLDLYSYGINNNLPKNHQFKNGVTNFSVSYILFKTRQDKVSIEYARQLVISVLNDLLKEINSNPQVRPHLDIYPFTSDFVNIIIHFEDENKVELGQGVSAVYLLEGEIEYERYEIREYATGRHLARGKHFTMHKETYSEALDILKKQDMRREIHLVNTDSEAKS